MDAKPRRSAMEKDALRIERDWSVWSVVASDAVSAVLQREDEDEARVRFEAARAYPKGPIIAAREYPLPRRILKAANERITELIDVALEQWDDEDAKEKQQMAAARRGRGRGAATARGRGRGTSSPSPPPAVAALPAAPSVPSASPAPAPTAQAAAPSAPKQSEAEFRPKDTGGVPIDPADLIDDIRASRDFAAVGVPEDQWSVRYTKGRVLGRVMVDLAPILASELSRDALGLSTATSVIFTVLFPATTAEVPKLVAVSQHDGALDTFDESTADEVSGSLRWLLDNRMQAALQRAAGARVAKAHDDFPEDKLGVPTGELHRRLPRVLAALHVMATKRIQCASTHCLLCDAVLDHGGAKPVVCSRALCVYGVESYGHGCDVLSEIRTHTLVVELLVSLTVAAAISGENGRDVLEPFCDIEVPASVAATGYDGPRNFYEDGVGRSVKAFTRIRELLQAVPSLEVLAQCETNDALRAVLSDATGSPLTFPLLQWIIASSRAHLKPLPDPEDLMHRFGTPFVFHLVSGSPEREKLFQEHKAKAGVRRFSWHGSPPGNWHAILRSGLRNYSNTDKMTTGALFGDGIYTALDFNVSRKYMGQPGGTWDNALFLRSPDGVEDLPPVPGITPGSKGITLVALCEIVPLASGVKTFKNGYITIQDENLIATRLLLVFQDGRIHRSLGPDAKELNLALDANQQAMDQLCASTAHGRTLRRQNPFVLPNVPRSVASEPQNEADAPLP